MNTDSYNFVADCPQCKESRGVSVSRNQITSGEPVEVYAIQCDHRWTLTLQDTQKLRTHVAAEQIIMRAHGIAIRVGCERPITKDWERFSINLGSCDCTCGKAKYQIFGDPAHYGFGEIFAQHIGQHLEDVHRMNQEHPDFIELPMSAEFPLT